jgi:hypothetical protein
MNSREGITVGRFIRQAVILTLVMLGSLSLYLVVLKWRGPAAGWSTQTTWDTHIPFWPSWVWPYLIPYLIGPAVAGVLTSSTFWWYIRRGLVVVGVTLAIFVLWPTHTVRPPVTDLDDGPTADLYRKMIAIDDPPANAAPSLHVSLICLLALAVWRDYPRWWPLIVGGTLLGCSATLFTWQHHLIDVATGAALAAIVAAPWERVWTSSRLAPR